MTRLLSGVALAGAALAGLLFLPIVGLRLLACVVALVAAREYLQVLHHDGRRVQPLPVLLLVAATCWGMGAPTPASVLALLLASLAWLAIEVVFRGVTVERAAARLLAPWYIGMPLGMLAAVHATGGRFAALLLIATVVVSDTAQYYSGRLFGRHPLAPAISPKKTVEGAIGGAVLAMIFLALAGPRVLPAAGIATLAPLGLAMAALGICGDLFESRLKRIAGVKDSGALIPGHGGVLDRIDALLFATPAFYLYVLNLEP